MKHLSYEEYLKLETILNAQVLKSEEAGKPAHDEMLFICIHQATEIWFKLVVFELQHLVQVMNQPQVREHQIAGAVAKFGRIKMIIKSLIENFDIMETMAPQDFLKFRNLIAPASGFQSFQFRIVENLLGLDPQKRLRFNARPYSAELPDHNRQKVLDSEVGPNLFGGLDLWLKRTPFLNFGGFSFWEQYKNATTVMLQNEKSQVENDQRLTPEQRVLLATQVEGSEKMFHALFNESAYETLRQKGIWRLSYESIHAVLLINLYRDYPLFQMPYRLLNEVMEVESLMYRWRSRHALMVKRILGLRIGTGGASGHDYLLKTAEAHQVFDDLFKLVTFYLPEDKLPKLPKEVESQLHFQFGSKENI
jgi:tryptophan 2,3-dioxygenase